LALFRFRRLCWRECTVSRPAKSERSCQPLIQVSM
jgi:hypothetical protein